MDLRELQGRERFDVLCGYLCAIGRVLSKPVLMAREGAPNEAYLFFGYRVESDEVVLLADLLQPWAASVAW